ncbi:hypothetical protein [Nocardia salmonicida]|uniref:hypothetical protein n=1 Tax=Nocardia salmonicida TaxID=53431 RepID=UPI0037A1FB2B
MRLRPWLNGLVAENTRSLRWTFLAAPDPAPLDLDERLMRLDVVIGGRIVLLPSPQDEKTGDRRWVFDPAGRGLPPIQDILDALLGVR